MDAKITKKRLNIFLSYDWIKIIALCVAAIVLWSLIFTMTGTRLLEAQNFTIMNYTGTSVGTKFTYLSETLPGGKVLAEEIIEASPMDLTTGKEYTSTLLQTRFSTGEGDVLFAADTTNGQDDSKLITVEHEDGTTEKVKMTHLEEFLYGYQYCVRELSFTEGGFFYQMEQDLNGWFNGDFKNPKNKLDEAKVEAAFRARIKKLNDKRYKTEKQIKAGLQKEFARIESYRTAYFEFVGYLEDGYIELRHSVLTYEDSYTGEKIVREGNYAVNLCPYNGETSKMAGLKTLINYVPDPAEDGTTYAATAKDVCLVILNVAKDKDKYTEYECVKFINYLVKTYGTQE